MIGRMIFFDVTDGSVLVDTGEKGKTSIKRDVDYYIERYKILTELKRDTFDYIELEYGQYAQDFAEASSYRVNPETKELEFSYPDPNEPEEPQPYIKPLSESVIEQMDYLVDVDFRLSMIELGL